MNEELTKKADILSDWIIEYTNTDPVTLVKKITESGFDLTYNINIKEVSFDLIKKEFMFLYINLVDRYVYLFLNNNDRNDFQNYVITRVLDAFGIEMDSDFIDIYNNRQDEFSKYKKLMGDPDKGESPQDGLFGEFGKRISNIISGSSNNVFIIASVETLATYSWSNLTSLGLFKSS